MIEPEVSSLIQVERHIADGRELIVQQRKILMSLALSGGDIGVAVFVLRTLLESQRLHEQHHQQLLIKLARRSALRKSEAASASLEGLSRKGGSVHGSRLGLRGAVTHLGGELVHRSRSWDRPPLSAEQTGVYCMRNTSDRGRYGSRARGVGVTSAALVGMRRAPTEADALRFKSSGSLAMLLATRRASSRVKPLAMSASANVGWP